MKIISVEKSLVYYVDIDDPKSYSGTFRRGEKGGWEELIGESWEPVYNEEEIEVEFQKYLASEG